MVFFCWSYEVAKLYLDAEQKDAGEGPDDENAVEPAVNQVLSQ
jgi:hypothetical protein